jgi:hypothetical protein
MSSITIRIDQKLKERLDLRLAQGDQTLSEFTRAAIEEKLAREPESELPSLYDSGKHVFGKHGSGRTKRARDHKRLYRQLLEAKHGVRRLGSDRGEAD